MLNSSNACVDLSFAFPFQVSKSEMFTNLYPIVLTRVITTRLIITRPIIIGPIIIGLINIITKLFIIDKVFFKQFILTNQRCIINGSFFINSSPSMVVICIITCIISSYIIRDILHICIHFFIIIYNFNTNIKHLPRFCLDHHHPIFMSHILHVKHLQSLRC
ncbi:hypothetical protein ACB098_10G083200 [Castanea mollissima]